MLTVCIKNESNEELLEINVKKNETIRKLKEKYCKDKGLLGVKFLFNGQVLQDDLKLYDYDIEDDDIILIRPINRGGGGSHICPYGCGRQIPDEYKGCTELLKAFPNYFN